VRTEFWWVNMKERGHLEDLGIVGNILKWIFNVVQVRDTWRPFVNALMNLP
jgi:hypothetical protein